MQEMHELQLGVPWNCREDLQGVHQVALHMLQQCHPYETPCFYFIFLLNVPPARKVSDEPDTADVEGPKPGERPKPRWTRQSPAQSTTSSSAAKRKVKFNEDDTPESNVTTHVSKRAKVLHDEDSLLSRADAAEVVGTVAMELQSIQDALDRTQEALAHFTSWANGK
jgi:hypothetical protein